MKHTIKCCTLNQGLAKIIYFIRVFNLHLQLICFNFFRFFVVAGLLIGKSCSINAKRFPIAEWWALEMEMKNGEWVECFLVALKQLPQIDFTLFQCSTLVINKKPGQSPKSEAEIQDRTMLHHRRNKGETFHPFRFFLEFVVFFFCFLFVCLLSFSLAGKQISLSFIVWPGERVCVHVQPFRREAGKNSAEPGVQIAFVPGKLQRTRRKTERKYPRNMFLWEFAQLGRDEWSYFILLGGTEGKRKC